MKQAILISNESPIGDSEYRKFREDDNWPHCPECERDELYNPRAIRTDGKFVSDAELIAAGLTCEYCGWQSEAYKRNTPATLLLVQENVASCLRLSG